MENNNILVSIIVPVYNGEKYIEKCIDELLLQTYNNFEILLINDGSTDNTKKIISKYTNDNKINIYNNTNHGVSYSRNFGIKKASGDYIMFVDCDDILDKNAISSLVNIVCEKNVDIIRFNGFFQEKSGKYSKIPMPVYNNYLVNSSKSKEKVVELLNLPTNSIRCYSPLLFIKNQNIIPFNENLKYLEDKVFYLENMLRENINILFINKEFYFYNYNDSSKTKNVNIFMKNMTDIYSAGEVIKDVIKSRNVSTDFCDSTIVSLMIHRIKFLSNNVGYLDFKNTINNIFKDNSIKKLFSSKITRFSKKDLLFLYLIRYKLYFIYYIICRIQQLFK